MRTKTSGIQERFREEAQTLAFPLQKEAFCKADPFVRSEDHSDELLHVFLKRRVTTSTTHLRKLILHRHEQWYHKSKLVPGVEKIPYRELFGFISPLIESLGGGTGGFATQPERTVFFGNDSLGIAPVICYESIFGQYLTEYVQKGAQLIFVMTNDGWWGNTAGYQQHLHYVSLRAIECSRSIARAANTGISCFINQRGIIEEHLDWQEKGAIVYKLEANTAPTFYVTYGDFIGRTAVLLSSLFILLTFVTRFTPHFANKLRVPKK